MDNRSAFFYEDYAEIMTDFLEFFDNYGLTTEETAEILFVILVNLAAKTQSGDDFLVKIKELIDESLHCSAFDQIITDLTKHYQE
ncbi:MAG: hypothetical protein PVI43_00965 [Candidatus Bathyarchaeota archaeon]|jgi:hypothetical protein